VSEAASKHPILNQWFIDAHLHGEGELQANERESYKASRDDVLFASWWRPAAQDGWHYDIQRRILSNTPWDVDSKTDPMKFQIPHLRYYRSPTSPQRPYHVISAPSETEPGQLAAQECMSCFVTELDGITTGA